MAKGLDAYRVIDQNIQVMIRLFHQCPAWPGAWRAGLLAAAVLGTAAAQTSVAQTNAANASATHPPAPRRPNIILILADDLGYGDLGCYGQTKIKTPNLDRLAAEGIRFTDFYAGSTVCAPSRCSLMTGFHTGHAWIRGNGKQALRPGDQTVAEALKTSGYHTGLLGKWGLGNEGSSGMPQEKGFDEFGGYLDHIHAHDYYTDYLWRYDPRNGFNRMSLVENAGGRKAIYTPDLFTDAALNFMRINQPDALNHYRPFFLFFSSTLPHAHNEAGEKDGQGMPVPGDALYSGEPWPQAEKNKAAMITRLDAEVGRLLDKLKELKIDDNTIIFFTSDNGPHKEGGVDPAFFKSSGPFRGIKRDLYEGGIRVPMIVRWPAKIKPGRVSDQVWAFWDFFPTVAELAGAKSPYWLDGISMAPTLLGKSQNKRHDFMYWEFHETGFQQAMRMGDWKAVRPQAGQPIELYNLKQDPGEQHDLLQQNPAIVARMESYFPSARTDSAEWPIKKPPPTEKQDAKK
jgi:arylsulfatase A-like enzyme